ncbi:uncharacterized protein AMSG_02529 [Thecamonas trahens ATCC 50062]|uniref:Uncharacterized protein n=1 Tax=Thecamonas trahens ATCC 50062 TaxID=461836 RepID=A0A0L0D591_THETB|nr:hypothetical protein AMSG_02529 [Thecamonas trahens ATCC 50062]KNC47509.1 hypothetical protein AMSG_02529 [Thecamonas trahens ATCC 50062]|eukprot:XP_013759443.1 hypothetical protein AMSG_02529 [Thecamonas trahens ATCC 50062]
MATSYYDAAVPEVQFPLDSKHKFSPEPSAFTVAFSPSPSPGAHTAAASASPAAAHTPSVAARAPSAAHTSVYYAIDDASSTYSSLYDEDVPDDSLSAAWELGQSEADYAAATLAAANDEAATEAEADYAALALPAWVPSFAFAAADDTIIALDLYSRAATSPLLLMTAALDGTLAMWDVSSRGAPRLRAEFGPLDGLSAATLVGDDNAILTGYAAGGALSLFDMEIGSLVATYELSRAVVDAVGADAPMATYALATSHVGFASAGTVGGGLVWDWREANPVAAIAPEADGLAGAEPAWDLVRAIDLSPDGRTLALGGYRGVHVYDLRMPHLPLFEAAAAHADYVDCVSLDTAGGYVVSSGRDALVHVWSLLGDEVDEAERVDTDDAASPVIPRTIADAVLPVVDGALASTNFALDSELGLCVVPSANGSLLMYDLDDPDAALRMSMAPRDSDDFAASFLRLALNTSPDRARAHVQAATSDADGNVYLWHSLE